MDNNIEYTIERLKSGGIFLSTVDNVMTIGWGQFGIMWGRKVFVAAIRPSRYSDSLVDSSKEFVLSVPAKEEFAKELAFVGKNSGRDMDKWKACSLKSGTAKQVSSYIVEGCKYYFECKVLTKLNLSERDISEQDMRWYPEGDFHNLYISEIVESY